MVNKVTLVGNLGQDPELRSTAGGTAVCNLRIATSYRKKDQDGNWGEETEWHSVVCFGKTAENVNQYCRKGKQLYVEGRLQTRKWQDKEGRDRRSTEVVAHEVKFLGGRGDSESQGGGRQGYQGGGSGQGYGGRNGGGRADNSGGGRPGGPARDQNYGRQSMPADEDIPF